MQMYQLWLICEDYFVFVNNGTSGQWAVRSAEEMTGDSNRWPEEQMTDDR
jgi:hypothetical protein